MSAENFDLEECLSFDKVRTVPLAVAGCVSVSVSVCSMLSHLWLHCGVAQYFGFFFF